jgi:DNA-binding response OmpR family regulator
LLGSAVDSAEESKMAEKAQERRGYVLAVDDSQSIVSLIRQILMRAGFEVQGAASGREALHHVESRRPDLVLLDVGLPDLSGFDVCATLKGNRRMASIPVIFLTGNADTASVIRGFAVGGVDYVTKPFRSEELVARVRTHVQLHLLRAILPICSFCSKIRNSAGEWERLESYMHRQTGSQLSHGVCPDCYEGVMDERRPR